MFEETLERLVVKSVTSMEGSMYQAFDAILMDAFEADTFDEIYEKIKDFFLSDELRALYNDKSEKDIIDEINLLKPIAALYCCYFGMDYIYQNNTDEGEKLDFSYIKDLYDCSSDIANEIYNILRGSIGTIVNIKEFEDTLYVNPMGYHLKAEKEKKDHFKSHIYLGNIKLYLDKTCKNDGKHLIMRDLVPSMTIIALRSSSSLPNGAYINRTKGYINPHSINVIDSWLLGQDFFKDADLSINTSNINTFNVNKIKYKTYPEIAKLINLAAADDVYRLDRLNIILTSYNEYIKNMGFNKKGNEINIAMASSLLLSIPLPILPEYLDRLDKLFMGISINDTNVIQSAAKEIFRFTSVTFPYLIGLLCYLLYYRSYRPMPIEKIESAVGKLEIFLLKNNEALAKSLSIDDNRIWSYDKTENAKKNVMRKVDNKGRLKIDWKENNDVSLGEVMEIVLSPQINNLKINTLISKNYMAFPTQQKQFFMKFWSYGIHGNQLLGNKIDDLNMSDEFIAILLNYGLMSLKLEKQKHHKIYKPEEYVLILVNDFLDKLSK